MRRVVFENQAFDDFNDWGRIDAKIHRKIIRLLDEIRRTPFEDSGKPEPLRGNLQGCWSRRITDEHRLVYQVTETEVIVLSCKYHYE